LKIFFQHWFSTDLSVMMGADGDQYQMITPGLGPVLLLTAGL
jgi:hypothetical protein